MVAGRKSASGQPLLANDPHLGIQMPSIWYEIGLHCQPVSVECPYDVRGLTFATVPGIVIGHNAKIAWGVTNVGWDTQDLYTIKANPENPLQYEWNGTWRDMTVRPEEIRFGDGEPSIMLDVRVTHLGPIINDYTLNDDGTVGGYSDEPLALRWTSYEQSTMMTAIMKLNQAANWDDFRAALRSWDTAAQNFIYADLEGNIGYQTPGRVPVRTAGHTGLLPVDGSSDAYEWKGYVPFENLPSVFNPERGYIATANQALVPQEYYGQLANTLGEEFGADSHYTFGYYWAYGDRGQRIVEMLEASDTHDFESFRAIQGDNKLIFAEEIAPDLQAMTFEDASLTEIRDWMLAWDYQLHMDSPQAALFVAFWQRLAQAVYDDQTGFENYGSGSQMWSMVNLLQEPDNAWWDDTTTADVTETPTQLVERARARRL
ncbi:penicillin acylase family protein [bacterium]|nr:penicillin acylase family protein [bacterium]